jgi:hypothetical protein
MNINVEHLDLFPTRIWIFDVSALSDNYQVWQFSIQKRREQDQNRATRSNQGGWSSGKMIFADPVFAPLLKVCQNAFSYAFLQIDPDAKFTFGFEAWANVNDPGGYNA